MGVSHYSDGSPEARPNYAWATGAITNTSSTTPTTDITGVAAFQNLFARFPSRHAYYIKIMVAASDTAYFRLNSVSNDAIAVTATTPYEAYMDVDKIYYAANGATPAVTIQLN